MQGAVRGAGGRRAEAIAPGQPQRPPTPTPPSWSWLPCGVSTHFGPGSPPPPPHHRQPPCLTPCCHSSHHARRYSHFTSSLALDCKPRICGTEKQQKPMKQTPVLKHSVLSGKEQPQSIGAAVSWTYAPVCTKSSHWDAGRRLEMGRAKGNPR